MSYYSFHRNTFNLVIWHKLQQFTNKYNFTKSKTNHNKYKIIHSYYEFVWEKKLNNNKIDILMLKLKKINLLIKNDKIHNKSEDGCCDYKK